MFCNCDFYKARCPKKVPGCSGGTSYPAIKTPVIYGGIHVNKTAKQLKALYLLYLEI